MKKKDTAQPVYDKRDSRGWKAVKHGVSSPHPSLTRISLEEARALGMCDSGELIISPRLGPPY